MCWFKRIVDPKLKCHPHHHHHTPKTKNENADIFQTVPLLLKEQPAEVSAIVSGWGTSFHVRLGSVLKQHAGRLRLTA